ncbi:hypothetical protein [Streptomyces sp. SCL15-4]|nr:hypothetical protein [Streptomyces sp. SCL15-4]
MNLPATPGALVLAALACAGIGSLCFLAAGIACLTETLHGIRARRRSAR